MGKLDLLASGCPNLVLIEGTGFEGQFSIISPPKYRLSKTKPKQKAFTGETKDGCFLCARNTAF